MEWFQKNKEDLITKLNTDLEKGLTENEAANRLEKYGPNELKEEAKQSMLSKIIAQFNDFLILILIGASIVSFIVGEKN